MNMYLGHTIGNTAVNKTTKILVLKTLKSGAGR
jgi:hypothetical protein